MSHEMSWVRSREFNEDIEYYVSDLDYSLTVFGCGLTTGHGYNITFDEEGRVIEVTEVE